MSRVRSHSGKPIHMGTLAVCTDRRCEWADKRNTEGGDTYASESAVRAAARQHATKTGHLTKTLHRSTRVRFYESVSSDKPKRSSR
jgi:hypothetical protein